MCTEINASKVKDYWQQIRKLINYKEILKSLPIEENNIVYATDEKKAEVFANYYKETFRENHEPQYDQQMMKSDSGMMNTLKGNTEHTTVI